MVDNFRQSATLVRPITNAKPVISNRPTTIYTPRPVSNVLSRPSVVQVRPVSGNLPTFPGIPQLQQQGAYQGALQGLLEKQNPNLKENLEASKTFWGMLDTEKGRNDLLLKLGAIVIAIGLMFISINGIVK